MHIQLNPPKQKIGLGVVSLQKSYYAKGDE